MATALITDQGSPGNQPIAIREGMTWVEPFTERPTFARGADKLSVERISFLLLPVEEVDLPFYGCEGDFWIEFYERHDVA